MVSGRGKFETVLVLCVLFTALNVCHADSNGGATCATCTVIFSLVDQTAVIHNESAVQALERICRLLPDTYQGPCKVFADFIAPFIEQILDKDDTADTICHKLGLCFTDPGTQECHLYPKKKDTKLHYKTREPLLAACGQKLRKDGLGVKIEICDLPGIKEICQWIDTIFDSHDPAVDLDGDRFSSFETLRGFAWRGKDCDDTAHGVHPGTRPLDSDRDVDSNCNGIKGVNAAGVPYEESLCDGTAPRGVAILGDSIGAHFHLPREWFNTTELSVEAFKNLPYILENELDWPAFSTVTGFMNATDTLKRVIHGDTDSLYLRMWQRNKCNFRDYQNIAVNGARASSMVDDIEASLFRNQTEDNPMVIFYALVGNDVCNGHPDTEAHMTTPAQMKASALKTLEFLVYEHTLIVAIKDSYRGGMTKDKRLPAGSHVMFTGLADGRVLYNYLHNRIHPIGSLHNDVTYADFYTYFNCLQISPCTGWMNTNGTLRDLTTKRAVELSAVLKDLAATQSYQHFKLYYSDNPINQVIDAYVKAGGQAWELLEPVDGFHSNQRAQALTAAAVWQNLEQQYPEVIGKVNPANDKITQMFGNQGGYR